MLNSEIRAISKNFPQGLRRDFDAHIYYAPSQRDLALSLQTKMRKSFSSQPIFVGELIDRLVGPHPQCMFETNFGAEYLSLVMDWLRENRHELTVLVHIVTGNDKRDHSEGAIWLGEALALDVSKLDP